MNDKRQAKEESKAGTEPDTKARPNQNFGLSPAAFNKMTEALKKGNEALFEQVFLAHFEDCIQYLMNRHRISRGLAYDASMDALLKFRRRLLEDKIAYGNMRFLFTRMAGQFLSDSKKDQTLSLAEMHIEQPEEDTLDDEVLDLLDKAWNQLGEECRRLLNDFYYQKIALKILAAQLNKSETAIRKRKQRCLEKLRSYFKDFV